MIETPAFQLQQAEFITLHIYLHPMAAPHRLLPGACGDGDAAPDLPTYWTTGAQVPPPPHPVTLPPSTRKGM